MLCAGLVVETSSQGPKAGRYIKNFPSLENGNARKGESCLFPGSLLSGALGSCYASLCQLSAGETSHPALRLKQGGKRVSVMNGNGEIGREGKPGVTANIKSYVWVGYVK